MDQDEALALAGKLAVIVEQFDRRCEGLSRQLAQLTQQMPGVLRQTADNELRRIPQEVMGSVKSGIERPVAEYEKRLIQASHQLQEMANTVSAQLQRAERLYKHLVWKTAGIALGSLIVLFVAGGVLSKHYYDEVRKNQLSAELLKLYNQAGVIACDGRLCAKPDAAAGKNKRYGEYVPVKAR